MLLSQFARHGMPYFHIGVHRQASTQEGKLSVLLLIIARSK